MTTAGTINLAATLIWIVACLAGFALMFSPLWEKYKWSAVACLVFFWPGLYIMALLQFSRTKWALLIQIVATGLFFVFVAFAPSNANSMRGDEQTSVGEAPAAPAPTPKPIGLPAAARDHLADFRTWTAAGRKGPRKTLEAHANECEAGWCTSTAKTDGWSFSVRIAEKNEWAARFETTVAAPNAACKDLGLSNVLRRWKDDEGAHTYCRFDGGPLKGLFGHVISKSAETRVVVFSKLYADHDPEFRSRVTGR